jgi:hypothetical protein
LELVYARLLGECAKASAGEQVLLSKGQAKVYMKSIETLMPLLGVKLSATTVRVHRTRPRTGPLADGDLTAGVLATLRDSTDWLTYRQITDAVLASHSMSLSGEARKRFSITLKKALKRLHARGFVVREKDPVAGDGLLQRWRLCAECFGG